jgi:hypothetical protein
MGYNLDTIKGSENIKICPEIKRRGVKNLHLVPRLRMRGAVPPLPNTSSWRGA